MPNQIQIPDGATLVAFYPATSGEVVVIGDYDAAGIDAYIAANPLTNQLQIVTTWLRTALTDSGIDPDNVSAADYPFALTALYQFCIFELIRLNLQQISCASRDDKNFAEYDTLRRRLRLAREEGNGAMIELGIDQQKYFYNPADNIEFSTVNRCTDYIINNGKDD